MSALPPATPLGRFVALVERHLGLYHEPRRWGALEAVLAERAAGDVEGYLQRLALTPPPEELRALADLLTVGESYFLRHLAQLEALTREVLPSLLRHVSTVRILCAGCSSGEESYSVALLARENPHLEAARLRLVAVDVSPRALALARQACYSPWALRVVPPALRERWFQHSPEGFRLLPEARDLVLFEERNLLEEDRAFWAPGAFHVILWRNVSIYFSPETTRRVLSRMSQALVPGGYLFLGPSETLRGLSEDFEVLRKGDAFYYRRLAEGASATTAAPPPPPRERPLPVAPPPQAPHAPPRDGMPPELEEVLRLVETERYGEAWARLQALPESSLPLTGLLRALVHLHSGRLDEAERLGRQLVAEGASTTLAHYLLGLCHEQLGDEAGARLCYAAALREDPTFALGHLRLGTLACRAGDEAAARVALRMALSLLPQASPLHVTLFGGGFGLQGLMQMGRQQLKSCTEALP